MTESFQLPLEHVLWPPNLDQEAVAQALTQLFEPGTSAHNLLGQALERENAEKFGLPEASNIALQVVRLDEAALGGRLRITYDLLLSFGCSGIETMHRGLHGYWYFKADTTNQKIAFEGEPYGDLRSTVDEF